MKFFFAGLFFSGITLFAAAQNDESVLSAYDPHILFSPTFYPTGETITRAATGEPNTGYWQNRADYQITASLNDITHEISASVTITYKNNSPRALPFLWLQLDQNLFNK
ncbi:MAG: M1 family peptidase, partial [Ferruginibacter sp.]